MMTLESSFTIVRPQISLSKSKCQTIAYVFKALFYCEIFCVRAALDKEKYRKKQFRLTIIVEAILFLIFCG
jgi:hypothetical protein